MGNEPTDDKKPPKGKRFIFRPWITLPDGARIYARHYGKRAFRIEVDDDLT